MFVQETIAAGAYRQVSTVNSTVSDTYAARRRDTGAEDSTIVHRKRCPENICLLVTRARGEAQAERAGYAGGAIYAAGSQTATFARTRQNENAGGSRYVHCSRAAAPGVAYGRRR